MLPVLSLGPLALPVRPLLLLLGLWLGLARIEREGRRKGIGATLATDALWGLVVGYGVGRITAWLSYGIPTPGDLLFMLRPLDPSIAPIPALLSAAGVIAWRWHRHRIPWRTGLDAVVPLMFALAIAWALGDWAEGRRYGEPTSIPFLALLGGGERHPVQLYEAGLTLLAWIAWNRIRSSLKASGGAFLLALMLYSGARLIVEGFRAESPVWMGFRVPQLLAFAGLLIGGWGLARMERSSHPGATRER